MNKYKIKLILYFILLTFICIGDKLININLIDMVDYNEGYVNCITVKYKSIESYNGIGLAIECYDTKEEMINEYLIIKNKLIN